MKNKYTIYTTINGFIVATINGFIVEKDSFTAHGNTIKDAIQDLKAKITTYNLKTNQ